MPDTIIRILADDLTGRAFKTATENAKNSYQQMQNMMSQAERSNKSFEQSSRSGMQVAARAAKDLAGELAGMATKYASVTGAVELAREAFMGFAEQDARMRHLSVETGRTLDEVNTLMERYMGKWKALSAQGGEELLAGFNAFRNAARLSPEQAAEMFDPILKYSMVSKQSLEDVGRVAGALHLTMGVGMEDMTKAMAMLHEAGKDFNIEVEGMVRWGPQLIDTFSRFGYTGVEGFQRMLIYLGSINKITGDTQKSTRMLNEAMQSLDTSEIGKWLGLQQNEMKEYLEQAARNGKDVLSVWVGLIDEAQKRGMKLSELPDNVRKVYDVLKRDAPEIQKSIRSMVGDQEEFNKSVETMSSGPLMEMYRLWQSIKGEVKAFGGLIDELGASTFLKTMREIFAQDKKDLEWITGMLRQLKHGVGTEDVSGGGGPAGPGRGPMFRRGIGPGAGGAGPGQSFSPSGGAAGKDLGSLSQAIARQEGFYTPGSVASRNNNPGNLKYGPRAKSFGATGQDSQGHAIFPNPEAGWAAMHDLLKGKSGQSLEQIGKGYAEDPNWAAGVSKLSGIPMGRPLDLSQGGGGKTAPPQAVLDKARQIAMTGDPTAVQAFMASQGYPRNGNWCGQFTASVVKAAGGTPPANPEIASNWRNYGQPVDTPQPGDIAVRRGVPTGSTGSHVTTVDRVDPTTGQFVGVGGNQRAGMFSRFPLSNYEFRRGAPPPAPAAPAASAPYRSAPDQFNEYMEMKRSLEAPIRLRFERDPGETQFRRSSMRREVDKEMRESRWASYADIGAA